jgi:hypothetical protein
MSQLTSLITVLLYLTLSLPAQEKNWEIFDSLAPKTAAAESGAQVIYEAMLRATDLWNQHDIEGYLEAYWKSPELVVIINLAI